MQGAPLSLAAVQRIFPSTISNMGAVMAATPACLPRLATRAPVLGLAIALGACSYMPEAPDIGLSRMFPTFLPPTSVMTSDALTVQRVRGGNPPVEPLLPESGNVWPAVEAPRPTLLGNADEAMRNIPAYSPALVQGAPPARSPVPTPGVTEPRSPVGDVSPPARRTVSPAPPVRPANLSGPANTGPIGGGAVIRDGNVETWIGPDGRTNTRIVTP
jgi:hypothetical protein